jgi:hypothetical protein
MAAGPLEFAWLWKVQTPDSVLRGVVRPRDPVGWELCVLQDDELVLRETFFDEQQAREYGDALRRRLEPLSQDVRQSDRRHAG